MPGGELTVVDGASAGAWIEPELTGDWGSVTSVVPAGFAAYARILHPAIDDRERPVRWQEVAEKLGTTVHPLVQWEALVGTDRDREKRLDWFLRDPDLGALDPDLLGPLCKILERHTTSPQRCFFGTWEGGHTQDELLTPAAGDEVSHIQTPAAEHPPASFTAEELRRPLLPLPPDAGRDYVVLEGSLQSAPSLFALTWFSMIWPEDRVWFMATDIDFDSTLVGGAEPLIEEILSTPEFEAFPIGPDDWLTWDADPINPLPKDDS